MIVKLKKFKGKEMKKDEKLLKMDVKFLNRKKDWRDYEVYEVVDFNVKDDKIVLNKEVNGYLKYYPKAS